MFEMSFAEHARYRTTNMMHIEEGVFHIYTYNLQFYFTFLGGWLEIIWYQQQLSHVDIRPGSKQCTSRTWRVRNRKFLCASEKTPRWELTYPCAPIGSKHRCVRRCARHVAVRHYVTSCRAQTGVFDGTKKGDARQSCGHPRRSVPVTSPAYRQASIPETTSGHASDSSLGGD